MSQLEQRTNIKFCHKLGKTATETFHMMQQVYGDDALSRRVVFAVYEEQLETEFSRETENVFTLSLYYDVDGIGTTPPPFL